MRSRIAKSLTVVALASALAACSSVDLDDQAKTGQGGTAGQGTSTGASSGQILDPFNPQSILAQQRSVYFDYDSYTVTEQYRGVVENHARYLTGNTQQRVILEGNTDARGGAEYNLALGQRRADAVRRTLTLLGVSDSQIETISLGKEKPKATGNTEADYAENRRADFVYRR
ncbi:18K peptidoglycan-associated outer membrane lipoprotein; Peptidoglycan-associated lipoprotein precursor; Outer membrane protein P6; OmpA/MotB precursor [plant metagenome]|jgi:peptidoglycan-associated lipoprotein|uniref:18K peptidoglycan-associated outer membrane lipoprotein Peptidoglycan-associated lipoprotein Outer membrane protein P6 OmpA/MotB n=1 Tax=plant metagenome TaxID=1297885 RepID=A0A484PCA3_9ZZZZ|nr:peptidoglycan-associated lipoprotein Pal [Orrella dioscoreae]